MISIDSLRERHFRRIRRDCPKIVETLGEQLFKIPALNKQVYVCGIDDDDYPQRYISTDKVLPSPPISATPSAKSSVAKSAVAVKISSKQMEEYKYGKGSCKKPPVGVLLLDE